MLSLCPMLRILILNRDGSQGLPMLLLQTKLHLQHSLCTSTNGRSCCSFLLLVSDDRIVWDYGMPLVRWITLDNGAHPRDCLSPLRFGRRSASGSLNDPDKLYEHK